MARPQAFDMSTVLDRAMMTFWRKGYGETSVQDLVEATGLNRGSLYNTFGEKAEVFVRAVAHYAQIHPANLLKNSVDHADVHLSAKARLRRYLHAYVDHITANADAPGCLLAHMAAGYFGCTPAMRAAVDDVMNAHQTGVYDILRMAQTAGDMDPSKDAMALAGVVQTFLHGLSVSVCHSWSQDGVGAVRTQALDQKRRDHLRQRLYAACDGVLDMVMKSGTSANAQTTKTKGDEPGVSPRQSPAPEPAPPPASPPGPPPASVHADPQPTAAKRVVKPSETDPDPGFINFPSDPSSLY